MSPLWVPSTPTSFRLWSSRLLIFSIISSIADMARTATNVVGAAAATTLVAATEGQLDKAVYNGEVEVPAAEAV